jgi:dTDP-4-dehydrorhamnose reductase
LETPACAGAGVILRTSWVHRPFRPNFVNTTLRLAATREHIRVVDDQHGAPTAAFDLAGVILDLAEPLSTAGMVDRDTGGIYHLAGAGETTWYGFAETIFAGWAAGPSRAPARALS